MPVEKPKAFCIKDILDYMTVLAKKIQQCIKKKNPKYTRFM